MRRVIGSTLLSLDGVIGSPHLWASERFDEGSRAAALEQLQASDAMLMGRRTYEIFFGLWPSQTGSYADAINAIPKYVFSSTLTHTDWTNSTFIRGHPATEVQRYEGAGRQGPDHVRPRTARSGAARARPARRASVRDPPGVRRGRHTAAQTERDRDARTDRLETLPTGVVVVTYWPTAG